MVRQRHRHHIDGGTTSRTDESKNEIVHAIVKLWDSLRIPESETEIIAAGQEHEALPEMSFEKAPHDREADKLTRSTSPSGEYVCGRS